MFIKGHRIGMKASSGTVGRVGEGEADVWWIQGGKMNWIGAGVDDLWDRQVCGIWIERIELVYSEEWNDQEGGDCQEWDGCNWDEEDERDLCSKSQEDLFSRSWDIERTIFVDLYWNLRFLVFNI